jgi:N-acyl-D-amino-acid deacylase
MPESGRGLPHSKTIGVHSPPIELTSVRSCSYFSWRILSNLTKSGMRLLLAMVIFGVAIQPMKSAPVKQYDVVIRNGTLYDGSGREGVRVDVAIVGDRIGKIGQLADARGRKEIDATGMAVAPGFINMLSWATESLLHDGRSQSDIRQGVTLEIFGEGESMGPLNEQMKKDMVKGQGDIKFDIKWTTLNEYLEYLTRRGVSCNVGSFVGATTVRVHELGYADRPPTAAELERMKQHVRKAMQEGALGVGSSLIYAPAFYAKTDELVALAKVAADFGGIYISHIRSEGTRLLEGIDELLTIAREAKVAAQIYHLKAAGEATWHKMDTAIQKIDAARKEGLRITADMYTYIAAQTGLDASMPPWVQEGGFQEWVKRLKDPAIRKRVANEMGASADTWENLYFGTGSPEKVLLAGFKNRKLKPLTGKTLGQVAKMRGKSPEETAMDLVIEDGSRVSTVYFLMSEENVKKQIKLPWVSFDSDAGSLAPEGAFLKSNPHPRAYGTFARLLGKYVREEKVIPLGEAIRRLTTLPAENLKLDRRGALKEGFFADVVVFDPSAIQDHATFDKPHQYSTGVEHVFVNGVQVLRNGKHTGAKPGRVVRGPGWKGGRSSYLP